jgi:cysteine desulfurase/selenocysteine lyase
VGLDADEKLDMQMYHSLLSPRTKLVAVPHVSNALGAVNPAKDIIRAAHDVGARVLLDACQSVPHMKVRPLMKHCHIRHV